MQSSHTAGFMSSVLSSMSSLDAMAQLLSESQLVPAAHRNKPDCFVACLKAMTSNQSPLEYLQAAPTPVQENPFSQLVLQIANAGDLSQLTEAENLMDQLTIEAKLGDDEANAVATIYSDRCRAIKEPAALTHPA